jgi:flagellar hook-associated protein 1 FlgK
MTDLLRIGSSAMRAAYAQLQTTGQNIANAATPGYVRREVMLEEQGDMGADGYVGRGVNASGVRRAYDEFLTRESISNRSTSAQDTARGDALGRLDRLFSDPQTGLGAAFDDVVGSFADLTTRPRDPATRSAALQRIEQFAQRAVQLDARITELRDGAQARMGSEVAKANDALRALAEVNRKIQDTRGSQGAPNALLDERDRLLGDLNSVLRANATIGQDGRATVYSQRGEALVIGTSAVRLTLSSSDLDPTQLGVTVVRPNGTQVALQSTELGGSLAGLMRFATQDVDAARTRLGRLTASVASEINAVQSRGIDADGRAGAPLLALGEPRVTGATTNTGNAQFNALVADARQLQASDYEIAYDGVEYTLTRLSDGDRRNFSAFPVDVDGLTLTPNGGTAAAGDRYLVRSASSFAAGLRALQSNPSRIATALPMASEPGPTNRGDLRVESLEVSSYGGPGTPPVTFTFTSPTTFDIVGGGTGNPAGLPYTPGMQLSYNGWTITLQGTPAAGDTLRVSPTQDPSSDNRNARALQAIGDARFVGGASVIDRYAELVGEVGSRTRSAVSSADMSQRLFEEAERARNAMSGVNLDEEAARMLQYQQAYQAAAKVIATANEMFVHTGSER